jgi:hypothetical protein
MPSRAPELLGTETPRLFTPPLRELTSRTSAGFTFIDFAEDVLGLTLLPWQKWLAVHALELRDDGRFRFRTVLVLVARQNGKSTFLQALLLWRMWADRIPMALIAAQSLEKAEEVWAGAVEMAQGSPELAAEMLEPIMAAGKKELRTTFGSRCKVQTANRKGGRSLSADLILLDELREHHTWDAWAALTKTTMARKNPQTWATTNAGDDLSIVLNDLRETGLRQIEDPATDFAMFEWSGADDCDLDDRQAWAQANPSLGRTISEESVAAARRTDPEWVFRTEVLCQRVNLAAVSPLPRWARMCVSLVLRCPLAPLWASRWMCRGIGRGRGSAPLCAFLTAVRILRLWPAMRAPSGCCRGCVSCVSGGRRWRWVCRRRVLRRRRCWVSSRSSSMFRWRRSAGRIWRGPAGRCSTRWPMALCGIRVRSRLTPRPAMRRSGRCRMRGCSTVSVPRWISPA